MWAAYSSANNRRSYSAITSLAEITFFQRVDSPGVTPDSVRSISCDGLTIRKSVATLLAGSPPMRQFSPTPKVFPATRVLRFAGAGYDRNRRCAQAPGL